VSRFEQHHPFAFPALLIGSSALAFGPWLVRLSGVGSVAAGFWRLALALPFLFAIAATTGQPVHWPGRKLGLIVAFAAFFFATDLAAWHTGIHMTKLGNATLFGNTSSLIFALWGLWLARRPPSRMQAAALTLAALGAALLMGSSAELSARKPQRRPARAASGPPLHRLPDRGSASPAVTRVVADAVPR
jgi:drug/metabolite transporter (DMT)-like permease